MAVCLPAQRGPTGRKPVPEGGDAAERSLTGFVDDPNISTALDVGLDAAPLALDIAGIEVPFVFDAASLYLNLRNGLYIGP